MNYLFSKNNLFVIDFCYYVHFIENIYPNLGKCSAQKNRELFQQLSAINSYYIQLQDSSYCEYLTVISVRNLNTCLSC